MTKKNSTTTPVSPRFRLYSLLSAIAMVLLLFGCTPLLPVKEPQTRLLYATGVGQASQKEVAGEKSPDHPLTGVVVGSDAADDESSDAASPDWGRDTLEVETTATVSQEATSYVESLMLARQEARDKAWREMAGRIAALPARSGVGKVGDLLKARPQDQGEVERMIHSAEIVSTEDKLDSGELKMVAKLDLKPVALLLYGDETPANDKAVKPEKESANTPAHKANLDIPTDPLQRKAFDRARENAQKAVLESLKRLPVKTDLSVGKLMETSPDAAQRVQLALDYVEVADIRFPETGTCEVDVTLNAVPIINNLKTLVK